MKKKLTPWCESVKIAMIERGWSMQNLADAIGMSRVYTSAVVHERVYSEATAKRISDTLGIEDQEVRKPDSWCKSAKIAMLKRGWGVLDLAKAANMSTAHVSSVINGRVHSAPAVKVISDILNIDETALSSNAN